MKKYLFFIAISILFLSKAYSAVNPNTASKEELESLSGIGPTKAQAIIEYRKKNGNFKTIEDLEKVPGIGPSTLNTMKKEINLGDTAMKTSSDKAAKAK